eukprot:IDg12374t1
MLPAMHARSRCAQPIMIGYGADESRSTWDVRTSAFGRLWRTDVPPPPERVPSELLSQ